MRKWSRLIRSVVVSISVICLLAWPATAGQRLSLRAGDELIVDSEETRKRLLTTELAVSRELIDMIRTEVVQMTEMPESGPKEKVAMVLTMIERIRAAQYILEQLDSRITLAPWLRKEELILQVLLKAAAVKEVRSRLREMGSRRPGAIALLQTQRELLSAATSLVPLQLNLAKACDASSSEESQVSRQWRQVEQRAKSLNDNIDKLIEDHQLDGIEELLVTAQKTVEEIQRIIVAASDLYGDQISAQQDDAAIQSHVRTISSRSDQLLADLDATIAEILPTHSPGARLRSLQIRKLALLRDLLLRAKAEARLGLAETYGHYSQALDDSFDAELELCKTTGERIARCRQHVRRLRDAVRYADQASRAGVLSRYEVSRMKIRLVDVEILLLREQPREGSR
jgi:hypothetical protein